MVEPYKLGRSEPFVALAKTLSSLAVGRRAAFMVHDGNWGDSLIREGAERFLQDHGINYRRYRYKDIEKGKVTVEMILAEVGHDALLVVNGSGALDPRYGRIDLTAALTHEFKDAVVLPSSYPRPLQGCGFASQTLFYTRDLAESLQHMPQALFCHDMAFYLQMPEITPRNEIGVFMRTDSERPAGTTLPRGNLDLSLKGRSETPINRFVAEIARHKVVFTNRLHIGICAAMLGREVHLSGNDYFKIRAIYEA